MCMNVCAYVCFRNSVEIAVCIINCTFLKRCPVETLRDWRYVITMHTMKNRPVKQKASER